MLRFCIIAVLVALAWSSASAQHNDVAEHYRAYRAALERQDLAAAASEAELALSASEARDGDGGRTGVLALNLAIAHLMRGDATRALPPAQRANSLAEAGASGLDPAFAALVLGRAELAVNGRPGADRLRQVLGERDLAGVPEEDIYVASAELGGWALRQRDYEAATAAWSSAATHAAGSEISEQYGYARARTWQAAAMFFQELGVNGRRRIDRETGQDVYRMLIEAAEILRPMAAEEAPNLELTIAQRAFADALALGRVVSAKMRSDHQPLPSDVTAQGDADGAAEIPSAAPVDLSRPRCLVRLIYDPMPTFPSMALDRGYVAGLVLRVRIGADGRIQENNVVSRIGDEEFAHAVERVAGRWRVEKRDDSPPNCRMETTVLVPISFSFGSD